MLHKETVEPATLGLLTELMKLKELEQFRLVGGTALSLMFGHRTSIDLDLFTDESFDHAIIKDKLAENFPSFIFKETKGARLLFTYINDVKIDFVNPYEKFSYGYDVIEGIRFSAVEEIIALKLNAIAGRGAKKDFWDLYELLNHYSFEDMIGFYQKRYAGAPLVMLTKSITYFVQADLQPDPECFRNLSWEKMKKDIVKKFNVYIQYRN